MSSNNPMNFTIETLAPYFDHTALKPETTARDIEKLCGEADQLTPVDRSHELVAAIPGAELALLPQCGHMLTMEQPQAVNARLLNWLARVIPAV